MKKEELAALINKTFGHLDGKQIMALTIYGEARGEKQHGRIAVGSTILERVDKQTWMGKTNQAVCLMPYQFSCYLPSDPNFEKLMEIAEAWDMAYQQNKALQECYAIASGLIDGTIPREPRIAIPHATHYKTLTCRAAWESEMKKVAVIGGHEFFA
jgi:spore germination cell wall hydrolase CwlJ-like protein